MDRPFVVDAATRLRASLERVALALAAADIPALMAAESGLAAALADLGGVRAVAPQDGPSIVPELIRARASLARCRVLGLAAGDAVALSLAAQGRAGTYTRSGTAASATAPRGAAIKTRL